MYPAVIAALLLPWAALAQTADGPTSGQRLTLLLNVGSVLLHDGAFSGGADHTLMYAAISSLSHRAAEVKLVVFDADRQHELLRFESFSLDDLKQVNAAVEKWKLGPVDYRALQQDPGAVDIVAALINEQLRADPPPDLVVFVDPGSWDRFRDKSARKAIKIPRGARPRFFALQFGPSAGGPAASQYRTGRGFPGGQSTSPRPNGTARTLPPQRPQGPGSPFPPPRGRDKIRPAVAKLRGKTFFMSSPGQLPRAVAEIERRAGGKP
jgi:hypothetical protein